VAKPAQFLGQISICPENPIVGFLLFEVAKNTSGKNENPQDLQTKP